MRPIDIEKLRVACRAAAATLDLVRRSVVPGMMTADLDRIVHNDTLARGGYPAPMNYKGFPRSVCTSVNDVACHGIPGRLRLKEGDAVNVDVTTIIDGHFGDTNATFIVGGTDKARPEVVRLVEVTQAATMIGIGMLRPGLRVRELGAGIEGFVESHGMHVVKEFGGHGIGTTFHAEPHIRHFDDPDDEGVVLTAGTILTVEPIVALGSPAVKVDPDGWTVRTVDGSCTAQFEHTVLITDDGHEVLTLP